MNKKVGPWIVEKGWKVCRNYCEGPPSCTVTLTVADRVVTAICKCGREHTYWQSQRMETHSCNVCGVDFNTRVTYHDNPQYYKEPFPAPSRAHTCRACVLEIKARRYAHEAQRAIKQAQQIRARQAKAKPS